jgi:pectinesterase
MNPNPRRTILLSNLAVILLFAGVLFPSHAVAEPYPVEFRVSPDGTTAYTSIQAAIDDAKSFPDRDIRIVLAPGIYEEKVVVWEWNTRLSLIGAGRENTVIRWDDHFERMDRGRNSTFHTATLRVESNDFRAFDLTVVNSAGPVGQAIALSVNADRVVFERVALRGHQDTLYLTGEGNRALFRDCLVEGSVDFIFGGALAVFENCEIRSLAAGYVTAASTPADQAAGFVFLDSRLTAAPGVSNVYLGRPWRDHAQTVFLRCEMGGHVLPEGWHDWGRPEARDTVHYAEFDSRGAGGRRDGRVSWSRQLDAQTAAALEPERLLLRAGEAPWFDTNVEARQGRKP